MKIRFILVLLALNGMLSSCNPNSITIGNKMEEYPTFPSDAKIALSISFSDFKDSIYNALDILGFANAEISEKDSLQSTFFRSFEKEGGIASLASKLKRNFARDYHIHIMIENKYDKTTLEAIHPTVDFIKKNFDYYSRDYKYRTTVITEVSIEIMGSTLVSTFNKEYIFRMITQDGQFKTQWNLFKAYDLSVK